MPHMHIASRFDRNHHTHTSPHHAHHRRHKQESTGPKSTSRPARTEVRGEAWTRQHQGYIERWKWAHRQGGPGLNQAQRRFADEVVEGRLHLDGRYQLSMAVAFGSARPFRAASRQSRDGCDPNNQVPRLSFIAPRRQSRSGRAWRRRYRTRPAHPPRARARRRRTSRWATRGIR